MGFRKVSDISVRTENTCESFFQYFKIIQWENQNNNEIYPEKESNLRCLNWEEFPVASGRTMVCLTASQPLCLLSQPLPPTLHLLPTNQHQHYCRKLQSSASQPGLFSSLHKSAKVEVILQEHIPTTFGPKETAHIPVFKGTQIPWQSGTQAAKYQSTQA